MEEGESIIDGVFSAEAAGARLDKALADAVPDLSRERIKALMAEGRVTLCGKPATSGSLKVQTGQRFAIAVPPPEPLDLLPQAIALSVAYEDAHLIVVDKPAGLVVHPAAGHASGTLVNALLHHCGPSLAGIGGVARPGIVHRIDKDTSGLLVVAKTAQAHEGLAKQFADHTIQRAYAAITTGIPSPAEGTVRGAIGRSDHDRKKMALLGPNGETSRGKHAVTHYAVQQRLRGAALVECRLETGRTHQVRVHMASIGHGLLGDPLYGRPPSKIRQLLQILNFHRQALHARTLGFIHPASGEALQFEAPLPADLEELLDQLSR